MSYSSLDWVGLETYDFRGPGNARHVNVTYNHAGLYGRSDDTEADSYLNMASTWTFHQMTMLELGVGLHCFGARGR